jgi:hypothetical protein
MSPKINLRERAKMMFAAIVIGITVMIQIIGATYAKVVVDILTLIYLISIFILALLPVGVALLGVGVTVVVQVAIALHTEVALNVASVYILALVPIGSTIVLVATEFIIAEAIHRRFTVEEKKTAKLKSSRKGTLKTALGNLGTAWILSAALVIIVTGTFYSYAVAALSGTAIPNYMSLVLGESATIVVLSVIATILRRLM